MVDTRGKALSRLAVAITVVAAGLAVAHSAPPASAVVTAVKGSACGYITNVGLFGGPQSKLGCPPQMGTPQAPATATTLSPAVVLPEPGGSATPITATDPDGAAGVYGPATIVGGRWPCDPGNCPAAAPPTGPITVSTQGTPASGTVHSEADITLLPTPRPVRCEGDPAGTTNCTVPGGFGPFPVEGDSLHVECTATEQAITGSTTFVNAELATATDSEGNPTQLEDVPDNPPVNYTRSGVITNVGDVFTVVYNEHIINPDGSLTVNAAHMYLFGPTAIGEAIKGQVTCGVTPSPLSPSDNQPPTCGQPTLVLTGPEGEPVEPQRVSLGLFDTSGIQSITNIQGTNVTVQTGADPSSNQQYLRFTPGQTGPLVMIGIRQDPNLPTSWSFDATDTAGNVTHVEVNGLTATCTGTTPTTTSTTTTTPTTVPPTTSSTTTTSTTSTSTSTTTSTSTSTTSTSTSTTSTSTSTTSTTSTSTTMLPTTTSTMNPSTTTTSAPNPPRPGCAALTAVRARVNLAIDSAEQRIRDALDGPAEAAAIARMEAIRAQVNAAITMAQAALGCSSANGTANNRMPIARALRAKAARWGR